jgi:hypothetical protein
MPPSHEPDEEESEGSPESFGVHDSQAFMLGSSNTQINFYNGSAKKIADLGYLELREKVIASQKEQIASQNGWIETYGELKDVYKRQSEELQAQLGMVKSLLPPLLQMVSWLEQDRRRANAEQIELSNKLENVVNENKMLRAEFDSLTDYLSDVDLQYDRVRLALNEVRVEEGIAEGLVHAIRTRWLVLYPGEGEPELPMRTLPVAPFSLTAKPDDETDVLAYCRKMLDEVHAIQVEIQKALEGIASDLLGLSPTVREKSESGQSESTRATLAVQRKLALAEKKLRDVEKAASEDKKKRDRQQSNAVKPASPRIEGTNGLFPGIGLFLVGLLIREVLKMSALSQNQRLILAALTVVLVALPCRSLVKWARSTEKPAPGTVASIGVFCVVSGYFCWLVALVPAMAAMTSVVATKKVGGGFVIILLGAVSVGILWPRVMWWSWTGFDWFARLF